MNKLTRKQERFGDEYLVDLNGTQAAIRAGYSKGSAEVAASRLLRNDKVVAYIQQRQKKLQAKTEISQEKVLIELAKIGFASITDYLEYKSTLRVVGYDNAGEPKFDWAMLVDARDSSEVDGAPIQEVSIARDGTFKLKLHNKLDALEKIGRHLGLFDKGIHSDVPEENGLLTALKRVAEGINFDELDRSESETASGDDMVDNE